MSFGLMQGSAAPQIRFEVRTLEDRTKMIERGQFIGRDVDFVVIRQAGSKDTAETEAVQWLERLHMDPNMKPEWITGFKNAYAQWKQGMEPAVEGTHINQWPAVGKAQATLILAANIRTVEELAAANEPSLVRIGMGARELQNKAKAWLQAATNTGKTAEELSATRSLVAAQTDEIAQLRRMIEEMAANAKAAKGPSIADSVAIPASVSEQSFI